MMFHVGQKVVCVNDEGQSPESGQRWITKGHVYVISWVGNYRNIRRGKNAHCVRLDGIDRSGLYNGRAYHDTPFYASRFRPVIERKTDISLFTAMLNPAPSKVTERVR